VADDQQASMVVGFASQSVCLSLAIARLTAAAEASSGAICGHLPSIAGRAESLGGHPRRLDSLGGAIVGGLIMGAVERGVGARPYVGSTKDFILLLMIWCCSSSPMFWGVKCRAGVRHD
jgi:hypothetical protein